MEEKIRTKLFFRHLASVDPRQNNEFIYSTPYMLLVAVILSARATDKSVYKVTQSLFTLANSPKEMLALGEDFLKEKIKTIGLFNNKARNIIAMSHILLSRYDGVVPASRQELESLPGVGRKSANVILNIAFGQPVIAVDTHVFRVCNRSGIAVGRTPLEVEKKLESRVPTEYKRNAHRWLLLHGRHICTARKANCSHCVVRRLCPRNLA